MEVDIGGFNCDGVSGGVCAAAVFVSMWMISFGTKGNYTLHFGLLCLLVFPYLITYGK